MLPIFADRADVGILVSPGICYGSPGASFALRHPVSMEHVLVFGLSFSEVHFSCTSFFFFFLIPRPLEATYMVGNTWIRFFIISFFFFLFLFLFS